MPRAVDAMVRLDHPVKLETATWAATSLARDDMATSDRDSSFWVEGWRRCAERGIQGLTIDPRHGGQGRDRVDALLTFEGLGHGAEDQGLVFALACQTFSALAAFEAGACDSQRAELLPGVCSGERIVAFAMTEPGSGSDSFSLECQAERTPDGYRLSGHKAYVTMGPVADVVIVFATVDPTLGRWGITAFLVDTGLAGVDVDHRREKMGLRTAPFGDVILTDVDVPESARLGPEGSGGAIFTEAMESERAYLFAAQLGQLERQLDDAVAYARTRRQFDRAIGEFQAVAHRIADMKARHEQARLLLYKTALLEELRISSSLTAALTKLAATEGAVASGVDALTTMGARGYLSETGIEREVRGAVGGLIYAGTSDIQRNIVAKLMGVGE